MEYLKIWTSFLEIMEPLNDSERGRLFTAMLEYAQTGAIPDLKGNERFTWPTAKQTIDRTRAESEKQTANGSKGGRPRKNPEKPTETQQDPTKPTETLKDKVKEDINKEKEEEETRTREDGPFGLTDEGIHASLLQDQQIEEAAKRIGLQTTEAGMMKARDLVRQYNLEAVLDAISKSVDVPKWAYVEGVLRGGKNGGAGAKEHRGNHSGDHEQPSGKYAFLFTDAAV